MYSWRIDVFIRWIELWPFFSGSPTLNPSGVECIHTHITYKYFGVSPLPRLVFTAPLENYVTCITSPSIRLKTGLLIFPQRGTSPVKSIREGRPECRSGNVKLLCFSSLYMNMYILYQYACLYYVHIVAVQQLKTIFFMRWNFHFAR